MRMLTRTVFVLSWLVIFRPGIRADGAGRIVKDSSGGILPGVTVEASSPSLIEKTRATVTDASGQYRLPELTPGVYALTFTLTGFATVKRENIDVTGSGVTTINADLRVGGIRNDHRDRRNAGGRRSDQHETTGGPFQRVD